MTKLWLIALAAATVTVLPGCKEVEVKAEAPIRPVKVESVQSLAQESRARYSATIQPDEQVALSLNSVHKRNSKRSTRTRSGSPPRQSDKH